jgi:sideroflexin-5
LIADQNKREEEAKVKTGSRLVLLSKDEISNLRRAQTVVSTAIHPDTGEFIPWVCRLSSFLPCNVPIAFGFIIATPTPFNTIFW